MRQGGQYSVPGINSQFSTDFIESIGDFLQSGSLEAKRNTYIGQVVVAINEYINKTSPTRDSQIGEKSLFVQKYINTFESADYQASIDLNIRYKALIPKKGVVTKFFSDARLEKINLTPGEGRNTYVDAIAITTKKKVSTICQNVKETLKKFGSLDTVFEGFTKVSSGLLNIGSYLLWKVPVGGTAVGILLSEIACALDSVSTTKEQKKFSQQFQEEVAKLSQKDCDTARVDVIEKYFSTTALTSMFADMTTLNDGFQKMESWLKTSCNTNDSDDKLLQCSYNYDVVYLSQYLMGLYNNLQNNTSLMLALSQVFLRYTQQSSKIIDMIIKKSSTELFVASKVRSAENRCTNCHKISPEKCCLMKSVKPVRQERRFELRNTYDSFFDEISINYSVEGHDGWRHDYESSWQVIPKHAENLIPADRGPQEKRRWRRRWLKRHSGAGNKSFPPGAVLIRPPEHDINPMQGHRSRSLSTSSRIGLKAPVSQPIPIPGKSWRSTGEYTPVDAQDDDISPA